MAATYDWQKDTGAVTGSPNKGTTRNTGLTEANWKNADDVATLYSAAPITAGNNSYENQLFGKFTGTFNMILNGLFAHTAGALGTGLTLKGIPAAPNTYIFTITSGNATVGATFTNNGATFTVLETISAGTVLVCSGTGAPAASGTLTKSAGTGDSTLTFSAYGQSGLHYTAPSTTANAALTTDMTTAIAIGSGVAVYFGPTGPEASGKATSSTNATTYSNYLTNQLQTTSSAAAGDTTSCTLTLRYDEN